MPGIPQLLSEERELRANPQKSSAFIETVSATLTKSSIKNKSFAVYYRYLEPKVNYLNLYFSTLPYIPYNST